MTKPHATLTAVLMFCCTALTLLFAGDKTTINGFVAGRTDDSITLQMLNGTKKTVSINDDTKVRMEPAGLGTSDREGSLTELLPGVRVDIQAEDNQGQLVASEVMFREEDLEKASMLQAGMTPVTQQVAAHKEAIESNRAGIAANAQQISENERATNQRFASLADYDLKGNLVINYPVGVSTLTQKNKAALKKLARSAANNPHFLIQVQGYADSSGNLSANQILSKERAEAVVNYLLQDCKVAPRHIVSPGAMGISHPVASNEAATGRAQNRRVDVKILVNKGLAGVQQSR